MFVEQRTPRCRRSHPRLSVYSLRAVLGELTIYDLYAFIGFVCHSQVNAYLSFAFAYFSSIFFSLLFSISFVVYARTQHIQLFAHSTRLFSIYLYTFASALCACRTKEPKQESTDRENERKLPFILPYWMDCRSYNSIWHHSRCATLCIWGGRCVVAPSTGMWVYLYAFRCIISSSFPYHAI